MPQNLASSRFNVLEKSSPLLLCQSAKHRFHILHPSEYPALTGLFLFCWLVPQVFYIHNLPLPIFNTYRSDFIHISFIALFVTVIAWFLAVLKESSQGFHTTKVQYGLRFGILLFIVSEVIFFFAFFWAFFHFSLVPSIAIGNVWPPFGTQELNVWGLPLANTLLLLASGVTITIAHAYLYMSVGEEKKLKIINFSWYLFLTIALGVTFLFCQAYEYKYGVKFSWRDNVYGSIFFVTTGFHGLHVTIGTLFLVFCFVRNYLTIGSATSSETDKIFPVAILKHLGWDERTQALSSFTPDHHFGFEAAAWYWHFVDVVWLFLFITVYWWGGK